MIGRMPVSPRNQGFLGRALRDQQNALRRGPCVHMLALRLVAQQPLDSARAQQAKAQNQEARA